MPAQPVAPNADPAAVRLTEPPSHPAMAPVTASRPAMAPARPTPPPARPSPADIDPISMTTEMEAVSAETQKRRKVDHTLARFSKVHDELKAEERERKAKRKKLFPWSTEDELDRLDEIVGMQTPPPPAPGQVALERPAEPIQLPRTPTGRKRRSALAGKVFACTAAALVFVASGAAWGFKTWVDSKSQQVDALDRDSAAIQDAAAQLGDENFLMVGSDTRDGAAAEDGVGDAGAVGGARADTIMIAHVPANRKRVVVVSFPRDLEVDRPECEGWDAKTGKYTAQRHPAAGKVKLNSVYATGGPKCVTKVVQQLSGLAINHFVGIDFNGFRDMVEAVHGVGVCVERPLKDGVLGTIVPQGGTEVVLTGDQALSFVRARHVQGDVTSDYGRITRQQRFLSALLRKAMSNQVLLDPGKLTGFVQAFAKSTFGDNLGVDQLMLLGRSMQGIQAGRVTFVTVPTVGEANDRGNEVLRVNDNNNLFKAIRDDAPLPGEAPSPAAAQAPTSAAPPAQPVDPTTIKIQVFNGGNTTARIAGKTADKLKDHGYQVMRVENGEQVPATVVRYGRDRQAAAATLASSLPGAQLQEDASLVGALILVIGPEFNGEVVAPTGAAQKPPPLPKDLSTVNGGDVSCA
jgi:LCP family protein required for cell wall assembly